MNLPLVLWEKLDWPRFDCVDFMSCPPSVLTFRPYFSFLLIIPELLQLPFACSMFAHFGSINSTRQTPCYGRKGKMFNVPSLSHLLYNSTQKVAPTHLNWSVTVNYHLKYSVRKYNWRYYYRDRQYPSYGRTSLFTGWIQCEVLTTLTILFFLD